MNPTLAPRRQVTDPAGTAVRRGIGVLGATGYSGMELIRLLAMHPHAALCAVGSRQHAGQRLQHMLPGLATSPLVLDDDPTDPRAWVERGVEVVFAALPHGVVAHRARAFLAAGLRLIDLSADFRLQDAAEFSRRYGTEHADPTLLPRAIYGLTEWCGPELEGAALVANPGCYATATLLALLPAVAAGLWSGAPLVVSALSGVSGAGRQAALHTHFVECTDSAAPYRVGEEHAHLGEMRQLLRRVASAPSPAAASSGPATDLPLLFSPTLVPMSRGILVHAAVPLAVPMQASEVQEIYATRYAGSPCVRVLVPPGLPETRHVRGSNRCDLALRVGAGGTVLLVFAAIDNLVKGAAGQAIQNWNRAEGWPESTGLPLDGWVIA
jgi:N-acetyl-gamma-glutamyl-phosphate reductase